MKIKITSEKSGLKVGETYDLCDMSAKTLINKGQAIFVGKKTVPEKGSAKKTK